MTPPITPPPAQVEETNPMTWISVSKQQFDAFVKAYPRHLESDVCGICEPIQRTLYDFSGQGSAYVAREIRYWLGPDGEIDDIDHRRFWTYKIQVNPLGTDIAKRIAETCALVGIDLTPSSGKDYDHEQLQTEE